MAEEPESNHAGLPVFPDERQKRIVGLMALQGKVHVPQLVKHFAVTEVTLRKDLNALEQKGLLKRTHGGAVSVRTPLEQSDRAILFHSASCRVGADPRTR